MCERAVVTIAGHDAEAIVACLTPASGRQDHDFAVRFARARLVAPKRPPHPVLDVRDDREPPLL